jgi:hypothetical protein
MDVVLHKEKLNNIEERTFDNRTLFYNCALSGQPMSINCGIEMRNIIVSNSTPVHLR